MSGYKELNVWKQSYSLVLLIYAITKNFPKEEIYGLVSQMRRSSISIPSNIAEGSKRSSKKDFCQFLKIAQGSGAELETQLLLSKDLQYISEKDCKEASTLLESVMKMLTGLINKLSTSDK